MRKTTDPQSALKKGRRWRRFALVLAFILIVPAAGLWVWSAVGTLEAEATALAAAQTDDRVTVIQTSAGIEFWPGAGPSQEAVSLGFVFYPGALVPPVAYAAHLRGTAEAGIPVIISRMPLNFAVLNPNRAISIVENHPQIERWVIGGHSLGGAMAAQAVARPAVDWAGLVLWAAYPAENLDLSGRDLPVLSLYGTQDGLIPGEVIEQSLTRLPGSTRLVAITGGNHAQFGRYGSQNGDLPATIPPEEQTAIVVAETVNFLVSLDSQAKVNTVQNMDKSR